MSKIVNGKPIDKEQTGKANIKRTKFENNKPLYGTYRFGEYGICMVWNGITGDKVKVRVSSDVDSYTLNAPLLNAIHLNKSFFQVPRMAMLPNAWEKIHDNPTIGDDINAALYGTSVNAPTWKQFLQKLVEYFFGVIDDIRSLVKSTGDTPSTSTEIYGCLNDLFDSLILNEYIFSQGSLINALGAKMSALWRWKEYPSWEDAFEKMFEFIIGNVSMWSNVKAFIATDKNSNGVLIQVQENTLNDIAKTGYKIITYRNWLNEMRDGERYTITGAYKTGSTETTNDEMIDNLKAIYNGYLTAYTFNDTILANWSEPVDLARLWAYQLVCAEFFTDDKVDYIYNAELYRQYIWSLFVEFNNEYGDSLDDITYELNGLKMMPDALSGFIFGQITQEISSINTSGYESIRAYITAIFKYNRSLKYKDYFTGARTRPIAIGNTNVEVTAGDHVEVVNIAAGIQKQRFLNVLNKIDRSLNGVGKGIFGKGVATDWHNPLFLGRTSEIIYGSRVENTGADQFTKQVSVTSTLHNEAKNFQFEFNLDRDSIIIGLMGFDIERVYAKGMHRSFMHVDRFDMFNPYMQYTGDQPIKGREIDITKLGTFGYTDSYKEFKDEYATAFGGFITALKGWTFIDTYTGDSQAFEIEPRPSIGPDFIRSRTTEMDRFYLSLSGYSYANYFHFIIENRAFISAVRPMAYKPQILM